MSDIERRASAASYLCGCGHTDRGPVAELVVRMTTHWRAHRRDCCNPDCDRVGTVYVGDLTTLGDYACSLCEVYIIGDGNDD